MPGPLVTVFAEGSALVLAFACAVVLAAPRAAIAQGSTKPPSPTQSRAPKASAPRAPKWEISFRGGLALGTSAPDASTKVPGASETFTMADGVTPTRAVSSWFLGDGATLLNDVLRQRGVGAKVVALEAPWPVASRRPGAQFGASIARHIRGGAWLEIAADIGMDPLGFAGPARDHIEATRASYESAMTALAGSATSVITGANITATTNTSPGGQRLLTSVVAHYRSTAPGLRPYLLAGAGVAIALGRDFSATLTGVSRFTTPSQASIEETDAITIRYRQSAALLGILGGGMERDLSRSSAFRIEARVFFSTATLTGYLDTKPSVTGSTPGGAIVLNGTSPGVQFSSTSGIRPSLSGPARHDFEVLSVDKRGLQWVLSGAYVRRF